MIDGHGAASGRHAANSDPWRRQEIFWLADVRNDAGRRLSGMKRERGVAGRARTVEELGGNEGDGER